MQLNSGAYFARPGFAPATPWLPQLIALLTVIRARSILSQKSRCHALTKRAALPDSIMPESKPETLDLVALESRVDDLIRTVDQLKTENSALRSQQDNLISERATLIEKTEQARSRIESMITRLRAMETRT